MTDDYIKEFLSHPNSSNLLNQVLKDKTNNKGLITLLNNMNIYDSFLNNNDKYCMILHNSVKDNFMKQLMKDLINIPKDWDILLLDAPTSKKSITNIPSMNNYIINRKACNLLMNFVQAPEWYLEWIVSNMAQGGLISVYSIQLISK